MSGPPREAETTYFAPDDPRVASPLEPPEDVDEAINELGGAI